MRSRSSRSLPDNLEDWSVLIKTKEEHSEDTRGADEDNIQCERWSSGVCSFPDGQGEQRTAFQGSIFRPQVPAKRASSLKTFRDIRRSTRRRNSPAGVAPAMDLLRGVYTLTQVHSIFLKTKVQSRDSLLKMDYVCLPLLRSWKIMND